MLHVLLTSIVYYCVLYVSDVQPQVMVDDAAKHFQRLPLNICTKLRYSLDTDGQDAC